MSTSAQVISTLNTFGGDKLDDFDQSARRHHANIADNQVDDGYCRGVCTDWLRRVIQGGKPWYDPAIQAVGENKPAKSTTEVGARTIQQTNRMATLQMNGGGAALPATSRQQRLNSAYDGLRHLYDHRGAATSLAIPAGLLQKIHEFQNFQDQGSYSIAFIVQLLDSMNEQFETDTETSWSSLSQAMDGWFAQQRQNASRHATEKPFSGITVGLSQMNYQNYIGLNAAANALLGANGFVAGTGVIAGFRIYVPQGNQMTPTGHAVAAYRVNNDIYYFFDPNYAIYTYNRAQIVQAIVYLFGTIYQENNWRVLDNHNQCGMRLSVFRRAT